METPLIVMEVVPVLLKATSCQSDCPLAVTKPKSSAGSESRLIALTPSLAR